MSRTHRSPYYWKYPHRHPKTLNELKKLRVSKNYYDSQYPVKIRNRYIPTAWDDRVISAYREQFCERPYEQDHSK